MWKFYLVFVLPGLLKEISYDLNIVVPYNLTIVCVNITLSDSSYLMASDTRCYSQLSVRIRHSQAGIPLLRECSTTRQRINRSTRGAQFHFPVADIQRTFGKAWLASIYTSTVD